jgi:hypothetical protein
MTAVSLSFCLLAALPNQDQTPFQTADEILQRARQTMQFSLDKIPEAGLQMLGKGTFAGMPAQYEVLFNRDGHFMQRVVSRLETGTGYDGKNAWSKDIAGEQRILELSDRRNALFTGLLLTSLWLDPGSGMSYKLPPDGLKDGACTLHFTHAPTGHSGTLRIDQTTWQPLDCTVTVEGRKQTTTWSDVVEWQGMRFPKRRQTRGAGESVETFEIETIRTAPAFIRNPYEAISSTPDDTVFDDTLPAELEVKRAKTGHLLVKPKVNGKDVGWFILDSGAGANVLATSVVKELKLETFGELPAVGVGGAVKTSFSRPDSISLGRATFKQPLVVGLDLAFLDAPMGEHIGGIIGYGCLYRCIVEVDMEQAAVALFNPKNYDAARVGNQWQKLYQSSRVSSVEAEFEGHRGIFKLDTGADNTVSIHAPTVEKHKLLDNRETKESTAGGVGGRIKTREGKLSYFELAGQRFDNVVATFALESKGAFNSADTMGNIGGALLKPFRIVFDYQNKRIAFVKRK